MTIAANCTCGKSPYYCVGGEGCRWHVERDAYGFEINSPAHEYIKLTGGFKEKQPIEDVELKRAILRLEGTSTILEVDYPFSLTDFCLTHNGKWELVGFVNKTEKDYDNNRS